MGYNNLRNLGENYIAFLQKIGQTDAPVTEEEIAQIIAPDCKKIVNGCVFSTSSKALPEQLNTARKAIGKWNIETLLFSASPEDSTCSIQIKWTGDKMPESTTMTIIYFDDMGKINQIHEVYNEYEKNNIGG